MNVNTLFNIVMQATVYGSVVGIIIFILKSTILRKLAAKWQYLLWSVMIIKLIFPNGPESKISIFNKINITEKISETDLISIAQSPEPIEAVMPVQNVFNIVPYIWLTGFVVAILWTILSFALLKYKIHTSSSIVSENTLAILEHCKKITHVHKNIKIIVQNHVTSTALCGIIHPSILITENFEKSDSCHIEHTFIHELSHYKRGDIAVNYLLLFLRCVHWFNPIIWFLFSKIRRDTELATDERTMLYLNPDEHKNYGMTLIGAISSQSRKSSRLLGMASNKYDIKKRITAIAKFKKPGLIQHISGIFTVMLIASISLTSAVAAKPVTEIILEKLPKVSEPLKIPSSIIEEPEHVMDDTPITAELVPETPVPTTIEINTVVESQDPQIKTPASESEKVIKVDDFSELENFENRNIDTLIKQTGQVLYTGSGTTDLTKYAKMVYYNTNYEENYTFTVKPNSLGYIQLFIENEGYDHSVEIGVSNVETMGFGWDYCFNTDGNVPIYLDGYDPDKEYVVTLSCYCPGYYDINGRILIY